MAEKIVQTAGRNQLGEFAPMFAHLNDDVLFGEVWNEEAIDVKTKCIITVVSLMASGITDSSLTYHLQNAKAHGVTKEEIAAIITHATMYVGWPKGWAVFRLAKEVWNKEAPALTDKEKYQNTVFFPIGEPNPYGQFFVGESYLAPVSTEQVPIFNVTFEPGCRNNWHVQLARPSRQKSGRPDADLRRRKRLLSGVGHGSRRDDARHRDQHSRRGQALARRSSRQLVLPSGYRDRGRGSEQRVARGGK